MDTNKTIDCKKREKNITHHWKLDRRETVGEE